MSAQNTVEHSQRYCPEATSLALPSIYHLTVCAQELDSVQMQDMQRTPGCGMHPVYLL